MGLSIIIIILIFIASIPFYFLPSILAYKKNHTNKTAILILNLFLGWTLIGWVGSLVWTFIESDNNTSKISRNVERK